MSESSAQLRSLRALRDSVIGSRTRKGQIVCEGKVPELISYIRRPSNGNDGALEMRSLAAIIVGSLAHSASSPTLLALLRGGAPAALLSAIADIATSNPSATSASTPTSPWDSLRLLETFLRALRAVMTALADEISPSSRFGIGSGKGWNDKVASSQSRARSHREPSGWEIANAGFDDETVRIASSSGSLAPRQELILLGRDAISEIFSSENLPYLLGPLFLGPLPKDQRSDHTFKHARAVSQTHTHSPSSPRTSNAPSTISDMAIEGPLSHSASSALPTAVPSEVKTRVYTIVEMVSAIISSCVNVPGPEVSTDPSASNGKATVSDEIASRRKKIAAFYSRQSPFTALAMGVPDHSHIARSVLDLLLEAAENGVPKTQEAALWALTEVTHQDSDISARLFRCQTPSGLSSLHMLLSMRNESHPGIRLAAFSCLAHLVKVHPFTRKTNERVLAVLIGLLDVPGDTQVSAAWALAHVVADQPELQMIACEAGYDCLKKLGALLKCASLDLSPPTTKARQSITGVNAGPDHPAHRLREAVLTALAALTFSRDELRRQFVNYEKPALVPLVVPLISTGSLGTRIAACRLIRALSRSVSILRTSLVDAGVGEQLVRILKDDDELLDVKDEVVATVCNLVLSFSPMRTYLLENGAISSIVELCRSSHGPLRLNATWAIKNVIFSSESAFKKTIMEELGAATLRAMAASVDDAQLQEQALNIIRNLASGCAEDVEMTIDGFGGEDDFFAIVEEAIWQRENALLVEQAAYVLVNVTAEAERHRHSILQRPNLLDALCFFLGHPRSQVRIAGIMVGLHLTQPPVASAVAAAAAATKGSEGTNTPAAAVIDPLLPSSSTGGTATKASSPQATPTAHELTHVDAVAILRKFGFAERLLAATQTSERDVADRAKILMQRFAAAAAAAAASTVG